ncbi:Molybdopterin synthase catalytic subunit [Savitreella phatthalungensis]
MPDWEVDHCILQTKAKDGMTHSGMSVGAPLVLTGLTHEPLNLQELVDRCRHPGAGAVVSFLGTTRDNFNGRKVLYLDYSAAEALASKTLADIAAEVLSKFPDLRALACVHRLGRVNVTEGSVAIVVASPHRTLAWRAAEYTLEEVKRRTEIWKLETFEGGSEEMVVEGIPGAIEQQAPAMWKQNEEFARRPLSSFGSQGTS